MGKPNKGGKSNHRNKRKTSQPSSKAPDPDADALVIELSAGVSFYSALARREPPAHVTSNNNEAAELRLDTWQDLQALLFWFKSGVDGGEATATLRFSPKLNKHQRAVVHRLTETTGHGALDTLSTGVGDQRHILVTSKKHAAMLRESTSAGAPQTEEQYRRGLWLYKWAQEHGVSVSHDEVLEALATNSLHTPLQEVMAAKDATQAVVSKLCDAARVNDTDTIKALHTQHPHVFSTTADMTSFATGETPQGAAARANAIEALSLLLDLGLDPEQRDMTGVSPLEASRRYEQCDAEGVLLQHGVHDPTGHCNPLETNLDPLEGSLQGSLGGSLDASGEGPEQDGPGQHTREPVGELVGKQLPSTVPAAMTDDTGPPRILSKPQPTTGIAPTRIVLDDAASDVSTCHTDLLQHVGSLSALSVADFLAREGDEEDKLVEEPIPDATDAAVAALASVPNHQPQDMPHKHHQAPSTASSSPSARMSIASSSAASTAKRPLHGTPTTSTPTPHVAFMLPNDTTHQATTSTTATSLVDVEGSVCGTEAGTEAGTLDSIRSVCGTSDVGSVDSLSLDVAAFAGSELLSAVPEDPEDPSSMHQGPDSINGAVTPATTTATTASDDGMRGFGSEQDLLALEDGVTHHEEEMPPQLEVELMRGRPAEIQPIPSDADVPRKKQQGGAGWDDYEEAPTLSELLWSLVPSAQQVEGWVKDPMVAGVVAGVVVAGMVGLGVGLGRRRR